MKKCWLFSPARYFCHCLRWRLSGISRWMAFGYIPCAFSVVGPYRGSGWFLRAAFAGYIARWFLLFVTHSNTRWESFPCSFSGSQMSDKQNVKNVLHVSEIGDDARNAVSEYFKTDTSQERNEKKECSKRPEENTIVAIALALAIRGVILTRSRAYSLAWNMLCWSDQNQNPNNCLSRRAVRKYRFKRQSTRGVGR